MESRLRSTRERRQRASRQHAQNSRTELSGHLDSGCSTSTITPVVSESTTQEQAFLSATTLVSTEDHIPLAPTFDAFRQRDCSIALLLNPLHDNPEIPHDSANPRDVTNDRSQLRFQDDYEFAFGGDCDFSEVDDDRREATALVSLNRVHARDEHVSNDDPDDGRRTGSTNRWVAGYKYTKSNETSVKLSYRCSAYRSAACPGKCEFRLASEIYTNFVAHTCTQSALPMEETSQNRSTTTNVTESMKREVDRLSVTTTATRSEIWNIVRAQFYGNSDRQLSLIGLSRDKVFRRVNRARSESFGGSVLGQIEVSPWSQILNADGSPSHTNFLIFHHSYYDQRAKTRERLIGWGHPVLLNMLKQKKTSVFIDGTFRCVPTNFKQCVVFSVYDRATKGYYPAAFVLCSSKRYEMYFHAFQHVQEAADHGMEPEFTYCDFEPGMIRAIRDHYPNSTIIGCLFHFKQACRRKMKKYRISDKECKIAMKFGVLDMLTVIPQHKVKKQGVEWVKNKISELCVNSGVRLSEAKWAQFWKYFQRTWIERFPPKLWNIEPFTAEIISRTNNPLERLNREINEGFEGSHPNLPDFVVGIEKIARKYVDFKADVEFGRAHAPSRLPIRIPKAVLLPEDENWSDEESKACDMDDSSEEESHMSIRNDLRRIVVPSNGTLEMNTLDAALAAN